MTEFIDRPTDLFLTDLDSDIFKEGINENVDKIESEDVISKNSDSSESSWSIDDSLEFMQSLHKPLFDELPEFSLRSVSPSGRSLFNLSISPISPSPISSVEDLSRINEPSVCSTASGRCTTSDIFGSGYEEDERISLDEITAQINTSASVSLRSNKRLNLETIFEDVFLETPKKRRLAESKRFNSWRINTYHNLTNEERINTYVFEQQQNHCDSNTRQETANNLCNAFENQINLNT